MTRVLFICHNPPNGLRPRGAEHSVGAIMRYLMHEGMQVAAYHPNAVDDIRDGISYYNNDTSLTELVEWCDVVLTWGRAARDTMTYCRALGKPYILMVRWWRNVVPLGMEPETRIGDLMRRSVDREFAEYAAPVFRNASAVITNTEYAAGVIKRWHGITATVSYVPIPGQSVGQGNPDGALTIVTPEIYGELYLVSSLAPKLTGERFLIVNCPERLRARFESIGPNVHVLDYVPDMETVWAETKTLLVPVYENDICGTRRVTIEAMRHGIPVIATDRSGMNEKVPPPFLVPRDATSAWWMERIRDISDNYPVFSALAHDTFRAYDTPAQLSIFRDAIQQCTNKRVKMER